MSIVLDQLLTRYEGHPVVNNVSLEVADGEFFVVLGPSGSGKSTLLRMIAGLVDTDGGRIILHGRDVTHLAPQARGIGLVFQNYALFRHMSEQGVRSEEHTSELQSRSDLVCRLLLEK